MLTDKEPTGEGEVTHLAKGYNRTYVNHGGSSKAVYFKGKIDEIRRYKRWITDDEVKRLFEM
jgi:hypothetical protein